MSGLRLATHLGIRKGERPLLAASAGSADPAAQIDYAARCLMAGVTDNHLMRRPPEEQSRIGEALARTGLVMGSFTLAPPERPFPWTDPDAPIEAALAAAHETVRRVSGGTVNLVVADSGAPRRQQIANARRNLARAADLAAGLDMTLALEACSAIRVPGALIERAEEAASLVAEIGKPSLRLILDTCHMSLAGEDPVHILRNHGAAVAIVQVADMPGRVEPGTGTLDLHRLAATLRQGGFSGLVEGEFWPSRPGRAGEQAALDAFRSLFARDRG